MRIILFSLLVTLFAVTMIQTHLDKTSAQEQIMSRPVTHYEFVLKRISYYGDYYIETVVYEVGINPKGISYILYLFHRKYKVDMIIYEILQEGQQWSVESLREVLKDPNIEIKQIDEWKPHKYNHPRYVFEVRFFL